MNATRNKQNNRFVPGVPHAAILHALYQYHYLTSEQTARLLYSKRYTQGIYQDLAAERFVQALEVLPRRARAGSTPLVFTLANRGRVHLAHDGFDVPRRVRGDEEADRSHGYMEHVLAVNDVLISLALLERTHEALAMLSFLHERELKRRRVRVQIAGQEGAESVAVIPDAWVELAVRVARPYKVGLAFEVDLGSEYQRYFRRKVAALAAAAQLPKDEAFGSDALQFAVLAVRGTKRRDQLKHWTELELTQRGAEQMAPFFLFAEGDPAHLSPEQLWCEPRWLQPFASRAVPMFEGLVDP